jgi:hypothetical protein
MTDVTSGQRKDTKMGLQNIGVALLQRLEFSTEMGL